MNGPVVSIIVPVYNVKDYLPHCVDSILAQTLQDWELLLVDDGSTDGSGEICDTYARRDERIYVIHQENAGVSMARNKGMSIAKGIYIGFVDADDWIEPEMFQTMWHTAECQHCSIVMCDAVTVYSDGRTEADTIVQLPQSGILSKGNLTPALLREMAGSVCRCLYKTDLLRAFEIVFPQGIKFSEDRVFNILCFGYTERIAYRKAVFYNRYFNVESTVHRFHEDYFEACLAAAERIREAIKMAWDNKEVYQRAYSNQLVVGAAAAICNYYYKTSPLTSTERRAATKRVCENKELRAAILSSDELGMRAKLMLHRCVGSLGLYAKLANLKHGR